MQTALFFNFTISHGNEGGGKGMRGEGNWRGEHGEMETGGRRGGSRKGEKSPSESLLFLNVWNCSTFL